MRKAFIISVAVLLTSGVLSAQDTSETDTKRSNHYVGIQANQLIRQLLNFGGSSSVASNPFLLSYSVNSKATGWGFTSGLGYTRSEVKSGDPLNPLISTINDFFLRVGFEKKTLLGKKWLLGTGCDVILQSENDKTNSDSQFGSFSVQTKRSGFGFGPRVTLNFLISERILIGTEASYYFKSLTEQQDINGSPDGGKDKLTQLEFAVPAVLYLTVKF